MRANDVPMAVGRWKGEDRKLRELAAKWRGEAAESERIASGGVGRHAYRVDADARRSCALDLERALNERERNGGGV